MDTKPAKEPEIYSRTQWVWAVNTSAVLGWLIISVPICAGISSGGFLGFLSQMAWAAAIGLPIAFGASWLITAPILKRVMRSRVTWLRTSLWGGLISFFIALAGTFFGRLFSWVLSMNPDRSSRVGSVERPIQIDGVLTAYGWLLKAQHTALFVAMGIVIALVLRAVIGPGQQSR